MSKKKDGKRLQPENGVEKAIADKRVNWPW